jgi:hypothetical protein
MLERSGASKVWCIQSRRLEILSLDFYNISFVLIRSQHCFNFNDCGVRTCCLHEVLGCRDRDRFSLFATLALARHFQREKSASFKDPTIPNRFTFQQSFFLTFPRHLLNGNCSPKLPHATPSFIHQLQLLPDSTQLSLLPVLQLFQQPHVIFLEFHKFLLKLLMPWIEHEDLEAERRRGDDEVCQREAARDQHRG